ncbi:hypothetical protein FSP39_015895 [Pinctada imbricata]|uniref:Protein inturned n=1 Tax=Pinctada imbricata TaxID=66713 RepID=A0AA88YET9_PINIB|nr:hypothetical protein FSP39_015895 [Pinctada imbricata]
MKRCLYGFLCILDMQYKYGKSKSKLLVSKPKEARADLWLSIISEAESVFNGPALYLDENKEKKAQDERLFYVELSAEQSSDSNIAVGNDDTTDDTGYGTDNDEVCSRGSWERSSSCSKLDISFLHRNVGNEISSGYYSSFDECRKTVDFSRMDNIHTVKVKVKNLDIHKISQSDRGRTPGHLGRILCKELIGIIPGHFRAKGKGNVPNGQRLCVRGLVPHSHAAKYSKINLGDCLRLLNGREVTWDNIDDVFVKIASDEEVSIVIQRATNKPPKIPVLTKARSASDDQEFVHLIKTAPSSGEDSGIEKEQTTPNHAFMVVDLEKLKSEEQSRDDDLLFSHPHLSTITSIRGAFVTIYQTMTELSRTCVQCSSVLHDGKLWNVCYQREENLLLLLSFPQSIISRQSLSFLTGNLLRLIRVLYGSVADAFKNPGVQSEITSLMSLWKNSIILNSSSSNSSISSSTVVETCKPRLDNVPYLPIRSHIAECLEGFVNSWEAADFTDLYGSSFGCRKTYTILGSCVFYKSWLLCNHLPREDLYDMYLYLQHQCFLRLGTEDTYEQLVIWRPVTSTRQTYDLGEEQMFGYTEPVDAKLYWLIVGHKHCILGSLFEARGGTLKASRTLKPDSLYIEQARATLIQINSLGLHKACKQKNNVHRAVTDLNNEANSSAGFRIPLSLPITSSPKLDIGSIMQKKLLPSHSLARKDSMQSDESMDSNSSAGSAKTSGSKKQLFIEKSEEKIQGDFSTSRSIKLSSGEDNCILHFLHVDKCEGLMISPDFCVAKDEIIKNFHRCCSHIKHMFDKYRYRKKQQKVSDCDKDTQLVVERDWTFVNMREEAVLFSIPQSQESSQDNSVSYWVVGRQRSREEVYMCFRDGTPQNMVELAFRNAFGIKC